MKQVLCAFLDPNEILSRELFRLGRERNWLIEFSNGRIPPRWSGDGIITNFPDLNELSTIQNFPGTPCISFALLPRDNIRSIVGDTRRVAEMTAEYFLNKGFRNFAAIEARNWNRPDCVPEIDPVFSLKQVLEERGIALAVCYWQENMPSNALADYGVIMDSLAEFFSSQPRPLALFVPSGRYLTATYRVLSQLKVRIPEEVAVLCNTDSPYAKIPTSCIYGEPRETACRAVELLDRMMAGETVPMEPVRVAPAAIDSRYSTDNLAFQNPKLAAAIRYLSFNFSNCISIEAAAEAAGCSHAMLVRLFQQHLHKTPLCFLQELRFNRILYLLDTTDLPLQRIAEESGYSSAMSLSLAFRRKYGFFPGEYRRSRRQQQERAEPFELS